MSEQQPKDLQLITSRRSLARIIVSLIGPEKRCPLSQKSFIFESASQFLPEYPFLANDPAAVTLVIEFWRQPPQLTRQVTAGGVFDSFNYNQIEVERNNQLRSILTNYKPESENH